jgi:hypothetical protein
VTLSQGTTTPTGGLFLKVIRGAIPEFDRPTDPRWRDVREHAMPRRDLSPEVNAWREANLARLVPQFARLTVARAAQKVHQMPFMYGSLWLTVLRGDGRVDDLGLASLRLVTSAGVNYICADIAGGASDSNLFKFHGFGTGAAAEATGDTALGTEETTQYNPDSTRPTGSQSSATNTYTTVATYSPDSGGTRAITEHGIFTQAATGGGTLLDRSVFAAVNLVAASDSLQATYVLTVPSGG